MTFCLYMLASDLCSLIGSSRQSIIEGLNFSLIVEHMQRGSVACLMLHSK